MAACCVVVDHQMHDHCQITTDFKIGDHMWETPHSRNPVSSNRKVPGFTEKPTHGISYITETVYPNTCARIRTYASIPTLSLIFHSMITATRTFSFTYMTAYGCLRTVGTSTVLQRLIRRISITLATKDHNFFKTVQEQLRNQHGQTSGVQKHVGTHVFYRRG